MADYSSYVTAGLTGAKNAITNGTNPAYPAYTGGQKSNPYATQQNATAMQGTGYDVNNALYNGIGRDASAIRNDYQTTVDQSWNQAQNQIKSAYGANGLYGSMGGGLMSGNMLDGAQQYATASATGRLAADQAIMANENNRTGAYRDAYDLAGQQNLDRWKTGMQTTDYNNNLIGANVGFQNSQLDNAYADQLARREDEKAWNQLQIENYLGLAGGSSPAAAASMQAKSAQQASDAASRAAWLTAGGQLAGGLLSSYGGDIWDGVASGAGSLWDAVSGWWD
jgi:hypothetical protein